MPFNGAGTFSRDNGANTGSGLWVADRDGGANILASRHDTHDQDLANGLTGCVTKDGQTTRTANSPMSGYGHTNVAAASALTMYARASQVQDGSIIWGGTAGGTANALTLTLSPAPTLLTTGQPVIFTVGASANTAASPTLNVNSIGAKVLYRNDGSSGLAVGELRPGTILVAIYDGTGFRVMPFGSKGETWTPTLSGSSSMTLGTPTIVRARFAVATGQGRVDFTIQVTDITVGGTPDYDIQFTLPVDMKNAVFAGSANVVNGGTGNFNATVAAQTVSRLGVRLYNNVVWSAGAAAFTVNGWYEI